MLLDTNIIILFLNGDPIVVSVLTDWKREGRVLFLSSISYAETLSLPKLTSADMKMIKSLLNTFVEIAFDNEIAEITAEMRRRNKIALPDAAIAASAIHRNIPLVTRDKEFQKISSVEVLYI